LAPLQSHFISETRGWIIWDSERFREMLVIL
jgi:hypothetical protein